MSTKRKTTDKKCTSCGELLIEVSIKNPYIDDFSIDCNNESCGKYHDGESSMNSHAYAIARQENSINNLEESDDNYNEDEEDR